MHMCGDSNGSTPSGASDGGAARFAWVSGKISKAQWAATPADSGKLPLRVKIVLGIGEAVQGIYITIGGYYLNSFLLETACIDPVYVGAMQAIQGVFDALNDPFIGSLSDRTRTRWGRRRPWLLFAAPLLALFYFGLWSALPKDVPQFGKFLYGLCMYCGVSVCITSIQVQIGALVPELTDNYDERTSVSGWRIAIMAIMGLLAALGHSRLVQSSSDSSDPATSFRMSALVLGVVMWAFAWTTFAGIQEKFQPKQESRLQMSLLTSMCSVWRSKSFLCVTGVYLCGPSAVVLIQSNFYMFSKYILADAGVLPILMLCAQGLGMVFLPFWVMMSMRFDKRLVYMVGGTGFMLAMCAIFFVQTREQAILVACLCGVNIGVVYLIPYSMLPDVVDEDELHTGKRREGIFAGFFTTALKFSTTSALTLTNLMLKGFGYSPPQATCGAVHEDTADDSDHAQNAEVLVCIRLLCSFVPAAFMLGAVFCAWLFPITREKQQAIAKLAAQRRLERGSEASEHPGVEAADEEARPSFAEVNLDDEQFRETRFVPGCIDGAFGEEFNSVLHIQELGSADRGTWKPAKETSGEAARETHRATAAVSA